MSKDEDNILTFPGKDLTVSTPEQLELELEKAEAQLESFMDEGWDKLLEKYTNGDMFGVYVVGFSRDGVPSYFAIEDGTPLHEVLGGLEVLKQIVLSGKRGE